MHTDELDAARPAPKPLPSALRWLGWAVAVLLCLIVFGMYTVPEFMVMLADQMWACF
ncbi:hypothetical protein CLU85_1681 [Acidovorax sp. 69]|uniref:hypothetical protein n=1 Tax=Acidovorax sp. 69 TaxID=2035202 RepID=UPI000CAED3A4|nr:hypothetical protein [Acidovorax sp. 69]PJI96924.1 hypothetical protein CLU85_1681 [Acidovorax sp. 69]